MPNLDDIRSVNEFLQKNVTVESYRASGNMFPTDYFIHLVGCSKAEKSKVLDLIVDPECIFVKKLGDVIYEMSSLKKKRKSHR